MFQFACQKTSISLVVLICREEFISLTVSMQNREFHFSVFPPQSASSKPQSGANAPHISANDENM